MFECIYVFRISPEEYGEQVHGGGKVSVAEQECRHKTRIWEKGGGRREEGGEKREERRGRREEGGEMREGRRDEGE